MIPLFNRAMETSACGVSVKEKLKRVMLSLKEEGKEHFKKI